jgi:hypothetical protein
MAYMTTPFRKNKSAGSEPLTGAKATFGAALSRRRFTPQRWIGNQIDWSSAYLLYLTVRALSSIEFCPYAESCEAPSAAFVDNRKRLI